MTDKTREVLDGIDARLAAATPGPWAAYAGCIRQDRSWRDASDVVVDYDGERPSIPNAAFIAAAPVDVARLTRAVEAVLELHVEGADWGGGYCSHCTGQVEGSVYGDGQYRTIPYPCPTVAAIENALNS